MVKALSINNLQKTYKTGTVALKGISFEVEQGDFFALLGPNGAGKSTTISIICSLVNKTSGQVKVFGRDSEKYPFYSKSSIGIVPQEFNFSIFETVEQVIVGQAGYYGVPKPIARQRTEKYLKLLELWDKRNEVTKDLSGGQKRRLMIARALVHEPQLLILDEPTAGVDIEVRRTMWAFLKELNQAGITIILTTHYLEEAEYLCKNIAIIDQGCIIENTSMSHLLSQLNKETFILDIKHALSETPIIEGHFCQLLNANTLEVEIHQSQNISHLFAELDKLNIVVSSLRNKANRLEELFLNIVSDNKQKTLESQT